MSKLMVVTLTVSSYASAMRTVQKKLKDKCQCFANEGYNEKYCEAGDRPTIELCLQDGLCHWGPDEISECQDEMKEYFEQPCHCLANGIENKYLCEHGIRPLITDCLKDDKCHWGPSEHPKC